MQRGANLVSATASATSTVRAIAVRDIAVRAAVIPLLVWLWPSAVPVFAQDATGE